MSVTKYTLIDREGGVTAHSLTASIDGNTQQYTTA